jgi:hypothetical protein
MKHLLNVEDTAAVLLASTLQIADPNDACDRDQQESVRRNNHNDCPKSLLSFGGS